jgi:hypothetical protein
MYYMFRPTTTIIRYIEFLQLSFSLFDIPPYTGWLYKLNVPDDGRKKQKYVQKTYGVFIPELCSLNDNKHQH